MISIQSKWTTLFSDTGLSNKDENIPIGRSSFVAGAINENVYIFSGEHIPRQPIDNHVYVFSLKSLEWKKISSSSHDNPSVSSSTAWPCSRVGHAGAVLNQNLYIYGGRTGINTNDTTLNDFWVFDASTVRWNCLSSNVATPPPLSYHAMTAHKTKVYVFGGCTVDNGRSNELWSYDIETQSWELLSACQRDINSEIIPTPRGGSTIAFVEKDNEIHVLFGYTGKQELADHYAFHVDRREWRRINTDSKDTPSPRSVTTAIFLPLIGKRGSLYVVS
jgi:N-acetylneuraminic acid mutarotase